MSSGRGKLVIDVEALEPLLHLPEGAGIDGVEVTEGGLGIVVYLSGPALPVRHEGESAAPVRIRRHLVEYAASAFDEAVKAF